MKNTMFLPKQGLMIILIIAFINIPRELFAQSPYLQYGIPDADLSVKGHGNLPKRPHTKDELFDIFDTRNESQLTPGLKMAPVENGGVITLNHYCTEGGGWLRVNENGDTVKTVIEAENLSWFIDNSVESDQALAEIWPLRFEPDFVTMTSYSRPTNPGEHTLWFDPNKIPGIIRKDYALVPWKSMVCGNDFIVKLQKTNVAPTPAPIADDGPPPAPMVENTPAPQLPPPPSSSPVIQQGGGFEWGYGFQASAMLTMVPYYPVQQQNCCGGNSNYDYSVNDNSIYEYITVTHNHYNYTIIKDTVIAQQPGSGWPQDGNGGTPVDTAVGGGPIEGGRPPKVNIQNSNTVANVNYQSPPRPKALKPVLAKNTPVVPRSEVVNNTPKNVTALPDYGYIPKGNTTVDQVRPVKGVQNADVFNPSPRPMNTNVNYGSTPTASTVGSVKNQTSETYSTPGRPRSNGAIGSIDLTNNPYVSVPSVKGSTMPTVQSTPRPSKGMGSIDYNASVPVTKGNTAIGSIDYQQPNQGRPKGGSSIGSIQNDTYTLPGRPMNSGVGHIETAVPSTPRPIKGNYNNGSIGSISDVSTSSGAPTMRSGNVNNSSAIGSINY